MKVFVAIYEHKHGHDTQVFATEAGALQWQTRIAMEWWDNECSPTPRPADIQACADEYWQKMANEAREFFEVVEHEVQS